MEQKEQIDQIEQNISELVESEQPNTESDIPEQPNSDLFTAEHSEGIVRGVLLDANRAAEGGRMTTRHDLVKDMEDAETILLALEGLREDIPDKTVIRAIVRCLWHILEYLIRRDK